MVIFNGLNIKTCLSTRTAQLTTEACRKEALITQRSRNGSIWWHRCGWALSYGSKNRRACHSVRRHSLQCFHLLQKCLKISGTSIPTKKRWSKHMGMSTRGWENLLADGLVMVTQFLNRPNASPACKGANVQSPSRWGRQLFFQVPYIHSPGRMFSGGQTHWVRKDSAEDMDNIGGDPTLSELRAGLLPWAGLTGIFCPKSSIKRSETKPVRLRPGRSFRGQGAHDSGKKEIHCYSSTISPDLLGSWQIDLIKQW